MHLASMSIYLHSLALSALLLLGCAGRSIHAGESHLHVQQQSNTRSEGREVSAEAREMLLPHGFGRAMFGRAGPQAGTPHAGNLAPSRGAIPQVAKGVEQTSGSLLSSQPDKTRNSVLSMGIGSIENDSANPPDQPGSEPILQTRAWFNEAAEMTPKRLMMTRRSLTKSIVAAVPVFFMFPDFAKAADTAALQSMYEADPRLKVLQVIGSWDKNKDGRISREEFEKGMTDYVPHELTPEQLDKAWARIENVDYQRRASDPSYAGNTLTDEQKQRPQPLQEIALPTDRVKSSIPKADGGFYQYPSPQQAYNAMVRKGKEPDVYRAEEFVRTHNEMNERGWAQVLEYESVTHPECAAKDVKLKKFNGDYPGRVKGSFDRHRWRIQRCGGTSETTYLLDYYDTKKVDERTMPYSNDEIEIRAFPDPEDPSNNEDIMKFKTKRGKLFSSTADTDGNAYK